MYLTLLATFVLTLQQPDANTKTVQNAASLVEYDWWENQQYMVSLHSTKSWDEGVAWFFRREPGTKRAWKGNYRFFAPKDNSEDLIFLQLSLTRQYDADTNWGMNTRYEPKGVLIEIPLEDSMVPDVLTLSVARAFFVDSSGNETTKRYSPSTFLERLAGEGGVKQVRRVEFLDIGQTLRMKKMQREDYATLRLDVNPPPGYRAQKTHIRSSTYKEPNPSKTTKPRHEELYALGDKSYDQKNYDEAIRHYTQAIQALPTFTKAYRSRAAAYQAIGEQDKTISDCAEAIRLESTNPRAYRIRGLAYENKRDYDRALADYSRAVELDKSDVWTYQRRGQVYQNKHDYARGVADLSESVRLDPKNARAQNTLAWLLATCPEDSIRNGSKAVEHAKIACELTAWKEPKHIDTLAAAYAEIRDFRRAVMWQTEATEMVEAKHKEDFRSRLTLFEKANPYRLK